MSFVLVVDTNKQPCSPVHPGEARRLLTQGKAAVFRRFPFTIILKYARPAEPPTLRLKIASARKQTGIALVDDAQARVVWGAEITHQVEPIHQRMLSRASLRRSRRQRKTRYRPPRFLNRPKPKGWLAPSLSSRVANIMTWVQRLCRLAPVGAISYAPKKFDTQWLQNPEIEGIEYQQGTLYGYEVRQYLLEKWHRRCAYCGASNVPLRIEHTIPRSRGGSDRVSNLALACDACDRQKGRQTAAEFGHPEVQAAAKRPLKEEAVINATRWAIYRQLEMVGLPLEGGTDGQAQWNRTRQGWPKRPLLSAACVGASTPARFQAIPSHVWSISATGHGSRQLCQTDKYGFPIRHRARTKRYFGFQTGDMVRAVVPATLKAAGTHVGRVTVRASGRFHVGKIDGVPARCCRMLQRHDGYSYALLAYQLDSTEP